ncbi:uncharacterized protein [Excalfactoria chinensis]|uniref:uncharacterized protein isoform X3 n=1 Tax=Excalfactoria chinensis TaxID=46218 RepID=UPI003B3B17DD
MPARVCISTARRRNLRVSPEAESRPARPWAPLRPHRASFVPPHRGVSAAGRVPSAWAGGGGSQACIRTCIHTYTRVQAAAIGTHTSPAVSPPPAPRHLPTPSRTSRTAASGPPRKGQRGAVLTPLISSRPPRSSAHPICRPHALKRGVSTQTARRWSPGGSEGAGGALPAGGHAALSVAAFKQRRQSTGNDFQGKTRSPALVAQFGFPCMPAAVPPGLPVRRHRGHQRDDKGSSMGSGSPGCGSGTLREHCPPRTAASWFLSA